VDKETKDLLNSVIRLISESAPLAWVYHDFEDYIGPNDEQTYAEHAHEWEKKAEEMMLRIDKAVNEG
jgi:hypothetical protein